MTRAKSNRQSFRRNRQGGSTLEGLLRGALGMGLMAKIYVSAMLLEVEHNLLNKILGAFPSDEVIDQPYVDRLAIAVYMCAIRVPFELMVETAGSVVNYGWNAMLQQPEDFTLDKLYDTMQKGFGEISPTMQAACTREVIQKTAHLLLNDWHDRNGSPESAETMHFDTHFYFDEVMQLESSPDQTAIRREGQAHIMRMPAEELADFDPDLIEWVKAWREEDESGE